VNSQWWTDDAELLQMLGAALGAAKAVPREFVEAGKGAFAWRDVDAELAALIYDSAREPALTRTDTAVLRALTLASPVLTFELEVTDVGLLGQVVPPRSGRIELETADGPGGSVAVDEMGFFDIRPAPRGRFRLWCRAGEDVDVVTAWITL
jgi:hypothetical protein